MLNSMIRSAKESLKARQASGGPIVKLAVTALVLPWKTALAVKNIIFNSNYRSIVRLLLFSSRKVHQTSSFTSMDRYPVIFSASRDYFQDKQELNILSYGCSTGEEVLTLRQYFPNARIIGTDINKHSLAQCRRLPVDGRMDFIYSSPDEIRKHGPFDAIFCMAVLQRRPHRVAANKTASLAAIYPFERFEETVAMLDSLMNPNGLLIIHFTQYSLMDTKVASGYDILGDYDQYDYLSPTFDVNSQVIPGRKPLNSIFIKKSP
ncbi:class I SAM-dependent methyltransferase [Paenibacillus kobensis]|uniref:class I SAM-dependent methyltransferase n=1 Tax=Paenibacillus kobensis TaxID=59841 RepID=UPI000FDB6A11|nr:methyltransferase domain-containing protein [Paenibacillus kobensis]